MKCQWCGKDFEQTHGAQSHCSQECVRKKANAIAKNIENARKAKCCHCGKTSIKDNPRQIFCSKECAQKEKEIQELRTKPKRGRRQYIIDKTIYNNPFEALMFAIVERAVLDYKDALMNIQPIYETRPLSKIKKECEKFFRSEWFDSMSSMDGVKLMKQIQERTKELVDKPHKI